MQAPFWSKADLLPAAEHNLCTTSARQLSTNRVSWLSLGSLVSKLTNGNKSSFIWQEVHQIMHIRHKSDNSVYCQMLKACMVACQIIHLSLDNLWSSCKFLSFFCPLKGMKAKPVERIKTKCATDILNKNSLWLLSVGSLYLKLSHWKFSGLRMSQLLTACLFSFQLVCLTQE